MTNPNDPKVTRALDAYIGYFLTEAPELKADMVQDSKLREAMARALDAADEPLPVREPAAGYLTRKNLTTGEEIRQPWYWNETPDVSRGTRGQQIQRVWIDEVPTQLVSDVAREDVERILNAWEASVSGPADGPAPDGKEWVSSVSRGTPSLFDRLRSWRRRAR
jgi:hypothetical protein